jgi:hypothetical protein
MPESFFYGPLVLLQDLALHSSLGFKQLPPSSFLPRS